MKAIIADGQYRICVPAGMPPLACEVSDGALVRAWVREGRPTDPCLSWARFNTLPLSLAGTAFQMAVWRALLAIPSGERISYGALARLIGRPGAARAVGGAQNANPILWRVPCHRVVRSDGKLGGFAAGLAVKSAFLEYEKNMILENKDMNISFQINRLCGGREKVWLTNSAINFSNFQFRLSMGIVLICACRKA